MGKLIKDKVWRAERASGKPLSRQRRWALRQVKRKLCRMCSKKAVSGGYCDKHLRYFRERRRNVTGAKWRYLNAGSYTDQDRLELPKQKIPPHGRKKKPVAPPGSKNPFF